MWLSRELSELCSECSLSLTITFLSETTAATLIVSWSFDNNLHEDTHTYNGYMIGNGSAPYVSGYIS